MKQNRVFMNTEPPPTKSPVHPPVLHSHLLRKVIGKPSSLHKQWMMGVAWNKDHLWTESHYVTQAPPSEAVFHSSGLELTWVPTVDRSSSHDLRTTDAQHCAMQKGETLMFMESKYAEKHHLALHGGHWLRQTESCPTSQNVLGKAEGEKL